MAKHSLNTPIQEKRTREDTYQGECIDQSAGMSITVTSEKSENGVMVTILIKERQADKSTYSSKSHETNPSKMKVSTRIQTETFETTPEGLAPNQAEESTVNGKCVQASEEELNQTSSGEKTKSEKKRRRQRKRYREPKRKIKDGENTEMTPPAEDKNQNILHLLPGPRVPSGSFGTLLRIICVICFSSLFITKTFAVENMTNQWYAHSFVMDVEHLVVKQDLDALCDIPAFDVNKSSAICKDNISMVYLLRRTSVVLLTEEMFGPFYLEYGKKKSKKLKYEGSFEDISSALKHVDRTETVRPITTSSPCSCAELNCSSKNDVPLAIVIVLLIIGIVISWFLSRWYYKKSKRAEGNGRQNNTVI